MLSPDLARVACVDDLRLLARRRLPRTVFDFIDGGADNEVTLGANTGDFDRLRLKPRFLADVSTIDCGRTVLGQRQSLPLAIGPTGLATLTCPEGELALARAAAEAGIPFTLSTTSGQSIEAVAATGPGRRWFQLYVYRDRRITAGLIERAAAHGYDTLVLTVDVPVVGKRRRDVRNGFTTPLRWSPASVLDFALHPGWCLDVLRVGMPTMRNFDMIVGPQGAQSHAAFMNSQLDPSLDWSVLGWLREHWRGPILIKGLLAVEDALQAADTGFDGIVVSNHGGRQQDGVLSSIAALARIAPALQGGPELFIDGGIRKGSDIVKAVALGARAALVGRATLFGAAAGGAAGVRHCLTLLQDEIERTLAHLGLAAIDQVSRDCLEMPGWPDDNDPAS